MSASSRNRAVSLSSGRSSAARAAQAQDFSTMQSAKNLRLFDPCAATASMFLYAQGSSIVCCHHDTLTIERRFSRHADEVQLLAVDNQSEAGAGRFVVSYDAGQTAIVWDLMSGDEIARFASYEHLTTAAWMRNGNVAFGNTQGSIILFEPQSSEHLSSRTLDQIAVTALAPSSDCRTFAIGYQNGSLLVATLQPRFTILHNLTTSRGPSPIVTLAWHASSSRQKSDMLAVQTFDGDMRVWSVAKPYNADDPAKVVRVLKKLELSVAGANWMGWSKNGRIIQYSDSETLSWDVRTKHVTHDSIPTLEHVKGLALYGPGASLFTLGPNNTLQQFDLNSPSIMVANVQHPANLLPPSPPNSIEEPGKGDRSAHSVTTINTSESDASSVPSSIPIDMSVSESDEDHESPYARLARQRAIDSGNDYESGSAMSSRSGMSSITKSSRGERTPGRYPASMRSRGGRSENTYISDGTSLRSSTVGKREIEADNYSVGYSLGTTSAASVSSTRSKHKPSRLRHEVPRSPDDSKVHDLFKYTRTRLSDIPYKHPVGADHSRLTNNDLRRQMLSTIFGWHNEIEDLIRDEMSRHPSGTASRILLAKWLGDVEPDMPSSSQNMSSSDWMLLALSNMSGQNSQNALGRTMVQRLLEGGDVHAAVTIMLGMNDHNDAIEIYISHKRYMEALILTCLAFPGVWERQAAIIRKWGEWAVQHGQQQLAIRCFACTDQESTEPWASPSAAQLNFQSINPSIPEILSPPLSPPGFQRGPQRSIAKTSALKLITSFDNQAKKSKFYSQGDGGQTPIAAGVTPIAESAVSPGGFDPSTAVLRPTTNSRFNTPTSARPTGPGFGRQRLPSIGEIPADLSHANLKALKPPSESRQLASHSRNNSIDPLALGNSLQRSATASPMMMRDQHRKVVQPLSRDAPVPPSPDYQVLAKMEQARMNRRNGSRDRIPRGLNLELRTGAQDQNAEITSPEQSVTSSTRFHWPSRRRGPGSVASSVTSTSSAGRGLRSNHRLREDYIHSLDAARSTKARSKSRTRDSSRSRHHSRERRMKSRETSEERGRGISRSYNKPKRSPTSPIPMSPQDFANLSTPRHSELGDPVTARKASTVRALPTSRSRASSRGSRRQSPDSRPRPPAIDVRGRGSSRDGSTARSPSSPLPLSANPLHYEGSEDEDDYHAAMLAREAFRAKHSKSATRGLNSPIVTKREHSESRRRDANAAIEILPPMAPHGRTASTEHAGDLRVMKSERQRKKEQAARELEERRRSLAKRALAPPIPHPSEISPGLQRVSEAPETENICHEPPPRSMTAPPKSNYTRQGPHMGLPATPKAMRLVRDAEHGGMGGNSSPAMPEMTLQSLPQTTFSQPQRNSPRATPHHSPDKETAKEPDLGLLTLLPSTVYQPPSRPFIPRSMSAPIPDDPSESRYGRKASMGDISAIDEADGYENAASFEHRFSRDDLPPPPPPPPPPMLKELQHLAMPPPPPPAPLPHVRRSENPAPGNLSMIEIVMDDDEAEVAGEAMLPQTPGKGAHARGRSHGDGSLAGRFSKATERLRSASRGRKDKSTRVSHEAPYESIPLPVSQHSHQHQLKSPVAGAPPPMMYDRDALRSPPIDVKSKHMSTGLHKSEMF